jgi:hypothetical protein
MRPEPKRCSTEQANSAMLRYVFAALLLFGCIAPVLAQAPNPSEAKPSAAAGVKMPDPMPGDHWTYQVKDEISGTVKATRTDMVTDVSKNEIAVRFDFAGAGSQNVIYDRLWNIKRSGAFNYIPNDGGGIRDPLTVGAQWKFAADITNARNGQTFKRVGTSRVVRQESITTKAGTFDALVIETNFTGRYVQDPTLTNQDSWLTWYVPDIDHFVKRTMVVRQRGHVTSNNTVELTEYGRKKE